MTNQLDDSEYLEAWKEENDKLPNSEQLKSLPDKGSEMLGKVVAVRKKITEPRFTTSSTFR